MISPLLYNVKKIKLLLSNPEIVGILARGRDKSSITQYLSIKNERNKMQKICDYIDLLLSKKNEINDIIEMTSEKFNFIKYAVAWYALIRKYKPLIIVETGVSMGWSSYMILQALKREKRGKLYSLDLNDSDSVKKDGGVGYLVPTELKKNWELIIGDSTKFLLPLLTELGKIDMFIHDSDHSYNPMKFEYTLAWEHLNQNGILCSDDINYSEAFKEFTSSKKSEIRDLHTFKEISRPSTDKFLRPDVGFFFRRTNPN